MTVKGRLITIEGIDGSGKSTLAGSLQVALQQRGLEVALLREPGSDPLAERIRELLAAVEVEVAPRAEALLYAAARAQLCARQIQPLREHGTWLILDRFTDSSIAYQGVGRRLGVEAVEELNRFATEGLVPDRTLLLWLDPGVAEARVPAAQRDRLERSGSSFFEAISSSYLQLAQAEPERIKVLDATKPPERLVEDALEALADLLPADIR